MSEKTENSLPDIQRLAAAAQKMLDEMKNGKEYPSFYVVNRLEKAAANNSTDQLIGNMRDVVRKIASKQEFISQKEISDLYDRMAGLGSTQSFRAELGDLLPNERQFAEKTATHSDLRVKNEVPLEPIHQDSELSKAFGKIFAVDASSSFATFNSRTDKSVEKVAVATLNALGYPPQSLSVTNRNDHYALCTALFATRDYDKVAVHIPVKISEGTVSEPEGFIAEGSVIPLTKENLFLHMKNEEHMKKASRQAQALSSRNDMVEPIQLDKVNVPKELQDYANLENALIAAASRFDTNQVKTAMSVVTTELKGLGITAPQVKVAGSNKKEIIFDASVLTRYGRKNVSIPVEFHNGKPIMPNKFYATAGDESANQFRFSQAGWQQFINKVDEGEYQGSVYRDNQSYGHMSLAQLMGQIVSAVSSKQYTVANDALRAVQHKYGDEQFKIALDKYSKMLSHVGAAVDSKRERFIEAAAQRGDLVKRANYSELFCPKLGVPLSKIAFDEEGRIIPRHRAISSEQVMETLATTTGNGSIVIK